MKAAPPVNREGPVIAIDGPAGSGKSTTARLLAERLGFVLLDTGALYRAMALHLINHGITPDDDHVPEDVLSSIDLRVEPLVASMKVFVDGKDVAKAIREERIGVAASRFSARPEVRRALLPLQRAVAAKGRVVAEGRDMGTVVFPEAEVKFFLTAGLEERSRRRHRELLERNEESNLSEVRDLIRARDDRDQSRAEAPLIPAQDALIVDTTLLKPEEVVDRMMKVVAEVLKGDRADRDATGKIW